MFRRIFFAAALLSSSAAWAQQPGDPSGPMQGTPKEEAACRNDAVRFCRDAIPDDLRVLACLQHNRKRISKACRQVLINHAR